MKRTATIDEHIGAANADMHEAQREHARASLQLVEDPSNKKAQAVLESLEAEIAGCKRKIKRLEGAKQEAVRLDTNEHKRAELKLLKDELERLDKGMGRQHELATKLVAAIEAIGPLLAEFQAIADDNNSRGWRITKGACGSDHHLADRSFNEHLKRKTRGAGAGPSVINAAYASGLGRTGLHLLGFVDIAPCEAHRALDAEMTAHRADVLSQLSKIIARREAELNGKSSTT